MVNRKYTSRKRRKTKKGGRRKRRKTRRRKKRGGGGREGDGCSFDKDCDGTLICNDEECDYPDENDDVTTTTTKTISEEGIFKSPIGNKIECTQDSDCKTDKGEDAQCLHYKNPYSNEVKLPCYKKDTAIEKLKKMGKGGRRKRRKRKTKRRKRKGGQPQVGIWLTVKKWSKLRNRFKYSKKKRRKRRK